MPTTYVNEICGCNVPHEVPPERSGAEFYCPDTETTWYWCYGCREWVDENDAPTPETVRGETYCDPYEHDMWMCDGCGDWQLHRTQAFSPCDGYYSYCESCWNGCDCSDCRYPEDDYGYDEYFEPGEEVRLCPRCGEEDRNLDCITEQFMCECAVRAVLEIDSEHPFILVKPLTPVRRRVRA